MRLGAENPKKTIAASALFIIALVLFIRMLSGSTGSTPGAHTAAVAKPAPSSQSNARFRSRKGGKGSKAEGPVTPSLDPRLHLAELKEAEDTVYDGTGRNIFVATAEPVIPKAVAPGLTQAAQKNPVPVTPSKPPYVPPPINLKFFGFASGPDHKRVFLAQDGDVFVAREGDIVQRRYKIVKINNNNIEVLDVLSNNRQTIPISAG